MHGQIYELIATAGHTLAKTRLLAPHNKGNRAGKIAVKQC